jgi:two-component system copper resistance phosphate regulon response regulator CusR
MASRNPIQNNGRAETPARLSFEVPFVGREREISHSRTMIVEHVWDQSFEGLTNIVDVYIRHLRTKVDEPFPTKLIHTVRGVGYSVSDTHGN